MHKFVPFRSRASALIAMRRHLTRCTGVTFELHQLSVPGHGLTGEFVYREPCGLLTSEGRFIASGDYTEYGARECWRIARKGAV